MGNVSAISSAIFNSQSSPTVPSNAMWEKTPGYEYRAEDGYFYKSKFDSLYPKYSYNYNTGAFYQMAAQQMQAGYNSMQQSIASQMSQFSGVSGTGQAQQQGYGGLYQSLLGTLGTAAPFIGSGGNNGQGGTCE